MVIIFSPVFDWFGNSALMDTPSTGGCMAVSPGLLRAAYFFTVISGSHPGGIFGTGKMPVHGMRCGKRPAKMDLCGTD